MTKSPRSTSRQAARSSSVDVERVEVVDQRLARVAVVDEQPVEPLLLEDDPVVDARRPVAGSSGVRRAIAASDGLVVGLGPAVERGQDVGQRVPDVQLVEVAAVAGPDEGDQPVVLEADLLAGVEVEVADLERDPRAGLALGVVEGVVGGDQAAVDRVAEVGQVEAAERAVPVGAVALAAVELAGGRPRGSRGRRRAGPSRRPAGRETPSIRAYISSLSAYFALKFRQKPPARKNGLSSLGGRAGRPVALARRS